MERCIIMDCEVDNFADLCKLFAVTQDKTMAISSSDCRYKGLIQVLGGTFLLLDPALCGKVVHLLYDEKFMVESSCKATHQQFKADM